MLLLTQAPLATKAESSDETVVSFSSAQARLEPDEGQRAFITPSSNNTHTEPELSAAGRAGSVVILGSRLSPTESPSNHVTTRIFSLEKSHRGVENVTQIKPEPPG